MTEELRSLTGLTETKRPHLVVNRGHYLGTDKLDEEPPFSMTDKEALIAFLKTFRRIGCRIRRRGAAPRSLRRAYQTRCC